jgi:hypothetical protein
MVTVGVDMGTIDFLMLKALAGDEVGRSAGQRFDSHEKVGRDILHLHVRARDCEHHEIRERDERSSEIRRLRTSWHLQIETAGDEC